MKTTPTSISRALLALALLWGATMVGCGKQATPPGANSKFGFVAPNIHWTLLTWEQGLAVMFVDGIRDQHQSGGHGSSDDPVHRQTGWAKSSDGDGYEWGINTSDGQTAEIQINAIDYDIAKGTVFVVRMEGNKAVVDQLDLDLSQLSDMSDCRAFIEANNDLIKLADGKPEEE